LVALLNYEVEEPGEPECALSVLLPRVNLLLDSAHPTSYKRRLKGVRFDVGFMQLEELKKPAPDADENEPFVKETSKGKLPHYKLTSKGRATAKALKTRGFRDEVPGPLRALSKWEVPTIYKNVTVGIDFREGGGVGGRRSSTSFARSSS